MLDFARRVIILEVMTRRQLRKLDQDLTALLDEITADMGRRERREAMQWYVRGLLLDGERKSMQPMAARLAGESEDPEAIRHRLQECVSQSVWDERELYRRLALKVDAQLPGMEARIQRHVGVGLRRPPRQSGHRSRRWIQADPARREHLLSDGSARLIDSGERA